MKGTKGLSVSHFQLYGASTWFTIQLVYGCCVVYTCPLL